MKTNDVRPGMQLRGKIDGKVYTAVSHIGGQDWRDQDGDVRPFGVASNYEPIPEPAPELCASTPCAFLGCGKPRIDGDLVHEAHRDLVLAARICACRNRRDHIDCHPFVAPQAKPLPGGWPDMCLKCRGDREGSGLYFCWTCYDATPMADLSVIRDAWDALHRKPAAKDIPSPETARPFGGDTEAARGGGSGRYSAATRGDHGRPTSRQGRELACGRPTEATEASHGHGARPICRRRCARNRALAPDRRRLGFAARRRDGVAPVSRDELIEKMCEVFWGKDWGHLAHGPISSKAREQMGPVLDAIEGEIRADEREKVEAVCNICEGYYDNGPGRPPCEYCTQGVRKRT